MNNVAKKLTIAQVRRQLQKAADQGAKAFYTICHGIAWLQDSKEWQDEHGGDFDAMNAEIDGYLRGWPGMNRSIAKKMYQLYPNAGDWEDANVIYLEARSSLASRRAAPKPADQETKEPVKVREHVRGGPKPLDLGDEIQSPEIEPVQARVIEADRLRAENEMLKEENKRLKDEIIELRVKVAKLAQR